MQDPHIETKPEMTVAVLGMHGPYNQTPEGMRKLYEWLGAHRLQPSSEAMPMGHYLSDPDEVPEAEAVWEIMAPLAGTPPEAEPDESGIAVRRLPETRVAIGTHIGPYDEIAPTYAELAAWIAKQGLGIMGPPLEVWYSDPAETPSSEYRTEVWMPVGCCAKMG